MRAVFRPDIAAKLTLVIRREEYPLEVLGALSDDEERDSVDAVLDHFRDRSNRPHRRQSEAFFASSLSSGFAEAAP